MLGKHVNVSVKNKKFMHKVLCVILAIVLVGLMVPHGLAAHLNAYAQNEAETPAAETQADNPQEESTPAEEVTTDNNAQSNEGEPVAEPVENFEWSVTATLSEGIYLDNTNQAVEEALVTYAEWWGQWEVSAVTDNKVTQLRAAGTAVYVDDTPSYGELLDSLNVFCYNGTVSNLVKGLPDGCFLGDFVYKNDRSGTHLDDFIDEGDHPVEPFIMTSIKINNTTMVPADPNPQLWYFIGSKAYVKLASWPTVTKVDYLGYNTPYEIDTTTKLLKVTAASEYGAHKVGAFTAKLQSDMYDSDGFTADSLTGNITPNLVFTANWKEKSATVNFQVTPTGVQTEGTWFKSVNGGAFQATQLSEPLTVEYNTVVKVINVTGYELALRFGPEDGNNVVYAFTFNNIKGPVGEYQYKLDHWERNIPPDTNYYLFTEYTIASDVFNICAKFVENHKLTHGFNVTTSGARVMTSKTGTEGSWTEAPATVYYDDTYYYKTMNDGRNFVVGKNDSGFVAVDYFEVQNLNTGYVWGKWTVGGSDVGETETQISADVTAVANLQIALTFKIYDCTTLDTTVGHVVSLLDESQPVAVAYAYPGDTITIAPEGKLDQVTIGGATYKAVCDKPITHEFSSWQSMTTVPPAPAEFAVTFKPYSTVEFTLNFGHAGYGPTDVDVQEYIGASTTGTAVDWTKPYYFTDSYSYWADTNGNLIIGDPNVVATQHKFVGTNAEGKTYLLFDKWTIDNLPLSTTPTSLTYKETAYDADIYFNVLPKVTFQITHEEGSMHDENTKIVYTEPGSTTVKDYTAPIYFNNGVTAWLSGSNLKVGNPEVEASQYVFSAISDGHYQEINQWKVGDKVIGDYRATFEMNNEYTTTAEYKNINDKTISGFFNNSTYGTGDNLNGTAIADIYLAGPAPDHARLNKIDSVPLTVDANDGYKIENLPEYCYVWINGCVDDYFSETTPDNDGKGFLIETASKADQNLSFMTESYNFISQGFASQTGKWTDKNYSKKIVDTTGLSVSGTYLVVGASGATITFDVKAGDKVCLNDLKVYSSDTNPPTLTASIQQLQEDGTPKGDPVDISGQREIHHKFLSLEQGVTKAKVTISTEGTVISRLDLHNEARKVTFKVDTTGQEQKVGLGSGSFDGVDSESQLDAPMGTTFACTSLRTNTLVFDTGAEETTTITAEPSEGSVFRYWIQNVSEGDENYITKDTVITCRFVLDKVYINFAASTESESTVDVPVHPETAQQISNDSNFDVSKGYVDTLDVQAMFAKTKYGEDVNIDLKINPDTDKAYMYKFKQQYPFESLTTGQLVTLINEEAFPGCEDVNNPVTIKYIIVERTPIAINVDLGDGRFTPDQAASHLTAIPEGWGGTSWTSTDYKVWSNTVYEEFNVAKLREATIDKLEWTDVFNLIGFYNGWAWHSTEDHPTEPTIVDYALNYDATYADAVWVVGTVTDSNSTEASRLALEDAVVKISSVDGSNLTPGEGSSTLTTTTDSYGKYYNKTAAYGTKGNAFQIIKGKSINSLSGHETHIQDEIEGVGPIEAEQACDFALDKGFTWLANPEKVDAAGVWKSEYSDSVGTIKAIDFTHESDPFVLRGIITMSDGLGSYTLDSGNQVHIYSDTDVDALWNDGFNEAASLDEETGSYNYVVWNSEKDMCFNSNSNAINISRIDYYVPWESYTSIYGQITHDSGQGSVSGHTAYLKKEKQKMDEQDNNKYTDTSSEILRKETNGSGDYYLVYKTSSDSKGIVLFTADTLDPDYKITDYSYYLDERFLVEGTESADIHGNTTDKLGNTANPELLDAIHVEGNVEKVISKQGETPPQYGPAEGANVSYSLQHDPGANYDYGWNEGNHGYAVVNSDGDYTLKLLKSDTEGGFVWFSLGDDYAQDGHKLMKSGKLLPHNEDIDGIDGRIDYLGSYVQITADLLETVDHYDVITYYNGVEIDRHEAHDDVIDTKGLFSDQGVFCTGYDDEGEHVLEYYVGSPDSFRISVKPIINEGYTYWSWKLTDYDTGKKETLNDIETRSLVAGNEDPYIFTLYTTESAVLTASGTSEGHAMWDAKVTVTSRVEQESITEELQVPAGTDFVREFPLCNHELANEVTEEIHTEYYFDGENFNIVISSAFGDDEVPYEEHWVLDPVEAEGYYFVGMSMNNVEMLAGDITELTSQEDLNLVPHYALIPEEVNAQTGDANNMWWLVGLAVFAMLGVAYGASRKQKGIRC